MTKASTPITSVGRATRGPSQGLPHPVTSLTLEAQVREQARLMAGTFYDSCVTCNPDAPIDIPGQRTVFVEMMGSVLYPPLLAFSHQVRRKAFREAAEIAGLELQYPDNRIRYNTAKEIMDKFTQQAEEGGV